jgi:hypothetical protein
MSRKFPAINWPLQKSQAQTISPFGLADFIMESETTRSLMFSSCRIMHKKFGPIAYTMAKERSWKLSKRSFRRRNRLPRDRPHGTNAGSCECGVLLGSRERRRQSAAPERAGESDVNIKAAFGEATGLLESRWAHQDTALRHRDRRGGAAVRAALSSNSFRHADDSRRHPGAPCVPASRPRDLSPGPTRCGTQCGARGARTL